MGKCDAGPIEGVVIMSRGQRHCITGYESIGVAAFESQECSRCVMCVPAKLLEVCGNGKWKLRVHIYCPYDPGPEPLRQGQTSLRLDQNHCDNARVLWKFESMEPSGHS